MSRHLATSSSCSSIVSRKLLLAVMRLYILIAFICQVLVDGRMRCNSYYCAGGNYGLVGDGDEKRSLDDNVIVRRDYDDLPLDRSRVILAASAAEAATADVYSLPSEQSVPSVALSKSQPEVADDGRLQSLLVRLAAASRQRSTASLRDRALPLHPRHQPQQQQRQHPRRSASANDGILTSGSDAVDRRRSKMLAAWLNSVDTDY